MDEAEIFGLIRRNPPAVPPIDTPPAPTSEQDKTPSLGAANIRFRCRLYGMCAPRLNRLRDRPFTAPRHARIIMPDATTIASSPSPPSPSPTRWLLKNTDTFAGFAHAMGSYLAGVALASRHGVGLIHRPQSMAHGLGFAFVDFFDGEPRGLVPPVYAPTLQASTSAMLVNGQPVQLYVQLATSGNATSIAQQLDALPQHSVLWLRKGRQAFADTSGTCGKTANPEVCYTALWMRERFWRAVLARRRRWPTTNTNNANGTALLVATSSRRGGGRRAARTTNNNNELSGFRPRKAVAPDGDGGPIRVCVHVRRGDVYYLGPKTRRPHPHWVETVAVLDVLAGVQRAIGKPLEAPHVLVDVFSETGWLANDTIALRAIAPGARVHLDSSPSATIGVLTEMAQADMLIMGSSGFSFWAGLLSCGVKVGYLAPGADPLPMRFVRYASTITTREAPFWPSAGQALRAEWRRYWACRIDPACRPTLCAPRHLSAGAMRRESVWTLSPLAQQQLDDRSAVQWRLPELVLWPSNGQAIKTPYVTRVESPSLGEMRLACAGQRRAKAAAGSSSNVVVVEGAAPEPAAASRSGGFGIDVCMRNQWLHNLTAFLGARRKVPHGVISVGG